MNLGDMKIATRLTLGFALMGLLIVGLGVVALWKSAALHQEFRVVTDERMPRVALLNHIRDDSNGIAIALRDMTIAEGGDEFQRLQKAVQARRQSMNERVEQLAAQIRHPRAKELLAALQTQRVRSIEVQQHFMDLMGQGQDEAARASLLKEGRPVFQAYAEATDALIALQTQLQEQSVADAGAAVASIQLSVGVAIALALGAAVVLALWIIRAITGPLQQAVAVARAVADGDLGVRIDAQGRSETALLLGALRQMLESLRSVVAQVRGGSESVAAASSQIAQANQDLSARTEQQASALEETAASMEQLNSAVRLNADHARQANQLAISASAVAERGGTVVGEVVQTMKGIQESSRRIADIIGVIDGIAFQTNILALNAAVEAARAGEQGRGFAVVASEVRALAGRSAEAAKEIKQLIGASVERVESGTAQVDQAGATMQEVVGAIQRMTSLMGEISAASTEQSQGVTQVGEAITQMDQVTQQNAALVEEMAAAANSLRGQAQELVRAVERFRLQEGPAVHRAAASAAPPLGPVPAGAPRTSPAPMQRLPA
ncbi:methyl-accepting chemotaxis protein [Comamonas granuli]|uniref:methyl-accepting chemotaxis protein n=1 Tax=Comamonas granuli TaxID=290309 RepID=UPI000A02B858|nr:methyl-accepting chemotaxis protein [Comamonas granuli]